MNRAGARILPIGAPSRRLSAMDQARTKTYIERIWDSSIVPELQEYIRIPNKSVAFDPEWQAHGHMDSVVGRFEKWAREHLPNGATLEVVRLPKRTPLLFIEIPGQTDDCILLYGHMDKQPEMAGWRAGLDAWKPKLEGDRLYGRGAADDGYAMFACLSAIGALEEQGIPHARCVVVIEACEESGSFDLPHYIEHLANTHRAAKPRHRARFRMRQLRAVMVHHLAARVGRRHAQG